MISWQTQVAQTLLVLLGPILIPRAVSYYRTLRTQRATSPTSQIQPVPERTSWSLTLLFLSASVALLSTLPVFHPENIFRATSSRLQTSTGVLFTRLAALRPLTANDDRLRQTLSAGGLEARLLYARLGPSVTASYHVFLDSTSSSPTAKIIPTLALVSALPGLVTPHLLHLFILGLATSTLLSGPGSIPHLYRTASLISALLLAAAELAYICTYDSTLNASSTRLNEIDFLYWKLLLVRGLAITLLDSVVGWGIWIQATNRASIFRPLLPSPSASAMAHSRLADHAKRLETVVVKMRGLGMLRNGSVRDRNLRAKADGYWVREEEVMRAVLEAGEVVEAQRRALGRVDVERVGREAEGFVESVLRPVGGGGEEIVMKAER